MAQITADWPGHWISQPRRDNPPSKRMNDRGRPDPSRRPVSRRLAWASSMVLVIAGCRDVPTTELPERETSATLRGLHYRAQLQEGARAAHVTLCFEGEPTGLLVPGNPDARDHVHDAHVVDGPRLPRRDRGFVLDGIAQEDCIAYAVDFDAMADAERSSRRIRWTGDSVLVQPSLWLWRPARLPSGVDITLGFELPEGIDASVPWPRIDDRTPTYRLDSTAFHWLAFSVFGRPRIQRFAAAGAQIELAVLDAPMTATADGLRRWATDAAQSVALLYETFPRERLQIVVVPVTRGGGTVYFGAAGRGGGPGVYILMDSTARDDQLPGGWTTVHELLHHGMPFVADAWMAEGWVSYYTEVVRTRMGHRSEQDGWRELAEAFDRGRRDGRGVSIERLSETMHDTYAYQGVYWSGAAIGFILDVEVREDSKNRVSLDDAMRELRRCCGDALTKWTAAELLGRLDRWYGKPLFTTTAREHLNRSSFPPVERAFARLGVRLDGEDVVLDDDHPNADLRRAIMAPRRTP